jgi:hypothetical protein
MRFERASVGLVVGSLFAIGCGSDTTGTHGPTVTLTAAQATILMARITELAPVHPELAWLADSANLVLRSGAEADVIPLTTDLAAGPFYAVGLQRGVQVSAIAFSTFDLIAFNDPSNPTDFIIVDGFMTGTAGPPPTSASGAFGGSAVNGHLFHVAGNTVTAWRAQAGTATLSTGSVGASCAGFQSTAAVTCAQSSLTAEFAISSALENGGGQTSRSASLAATTVAGILLSYHFP